MIHVIFVDVVCYCFYCCYLLLFVFIFVVVVVVVVVDAILFFPTGLDSLCAPFLSLNFNNEGIVILAYRLHQCTCMKAVHSALLAHVQMYTN